MANQLENLLRLNRTPEMPRGSNRLAGVVEPAMTVGSNILAEIPAYAAGMTELNQTGLPSEGFSRLEEVSEMLTYNPRTMEGQAGLQSLTNGVMKVMDTLGVDEAVAYLNNTVVPRIQETFGEDAAREIGSSVMMAIPFVRKVPRLPMDQASRMQRAEDLGYTKDVYHGTYSDFEEFDQGDLGYHVGSPEQAEARLLDLERQRVFGSSGTRGGINVGEGGQIMPLKARIENSLQMKDVGDWKDPYQVVVGLRDTPVGRTRRNELLNLEDEMTPEMESFIYGEESWRDSPEAEEFMQEIKGMIQEDGYDSIRYANEVENKYGNLPGLTPQGKAKVAELQKEITAINDAAYQRSSPPPLEASAEDIELYLNTPRGPNTEESQIIKNLQNKIRNIKNSDVYESDSYILLDGDQLRSKNAEFDPDKIESSNILSSIFNQRFGNVA